MNVSVTRRLASFAIAAVLTLGMLGAIDGLATGDASPALLARMAATMPG